MSSYKQKGFTVFEAVLGIALVGVIGVASYFAYQNHQKTNQPAVVEKASPTATTTPTASPASKSFEVSDWRIRLSLSTTLANLTPSAVSASSYSTADQDVSIYAPELDASWTCAAVDGHKGLIGSISRTTQAKRSGPYEPLATKKIGTYTYGFEATETSSCTTSPKYQELVTSFKVAFQGLQTY